MADKSFQNGHAPRESIAELETLSPVELALHTRLLDDGAAFRARLPDVAQVTRRAILLVDADAPHLSGDEPEIALVDKPASRERITARDTPPPRHAVRRLPALAATLAIVGLLVALFATFAPGRFAGNPTLPITHPLSGGPWMSPWGTGFPPYAPNTEASYYMAPGNPRALYYVGVSIDRATGAATYEILGRLDNNQHWIQEPFPVLNGAGTNSSGSQAGAVGYRLDVM
ncbi:MAG: hypothetical protein ACRDHP_17305, partial [Ktedonobacterales bacterium]